MNEKAIRNSRERLTKEYERLVKSISRNRSDVEEIFAAKTEDESDLATMSYGKDVLNSLHESDFTRLRFIQEAIKLLDRGQYGECTRCGEDIGEKRITAVPWATRCIQCQQKSESEHTVSRTASASSEKQMDF